MKPFWMMPCRSSAERAARAAAKTAFVAAHPLPKPELRPVRTSRYGGYYVSNSGHHHFYGGQPDRRIAEMAARADVPPLPDSLRAFERDGQLFWLGQRGIYSINISTPEAFRASLNTAISSDSSQQATAAPAGLPGNER